MSLSRETFLPEGQEPKNISDILEIRRKLFDPTINPTSNRIKEGQINPGHPDNCWTLNTFVDTIIPISSKDSKELAVQPCAFCHVNFFCYPNHFKKPENPNSDISQALMTIESLSRK